MGIKEAWSALWGKTSQNQAPPLPEGARAAPLPIQQNAPQLPLNDPASQLGPGVPPQSMPLGGEPRQWQFRPGWNIPSPPGEGRITAETLRFFADNYDLLRRCIEVRKAELKSLAWDIVPRETNKKRSRALREHHADTIAQIKEFFAYPEAYMVREGGKWVRKGYVTWDEWLGAILEDYFVGDWMTIYPRRKLNGELLRLERVDGSTIKPLLSLDGRIPLPPEPAYSQWLHGRTAANFTLDDLLYKPRNRRNHTPHGNSHVEQILAHINEAIRYQMWTSAYFTDGSLPESFFTAPENWNVDQIREFNEYINAELAGNVKALRQFHLIPHGSTLLNVKPFGFDDLFARYLAEKTCILMDVQPVEVGWSPKSGLGGAGFSEEQGKINKRKSQVPLARWLAGIMTEIVHRHWGATDLEFSFTDILDEDEAKHVETDKQRLLSAQATLDQILQEHGEEPVGMNTPILMAGTTVYFLPDLLKAQKEGAQAVSSFGGLDPFGGGPGGFGPGRRGGNDDEEGEELDDERDGQPRKQPPNRSQTGGAGEDEAEASKAALAADLARWKRKALKDVKAGKKPRPFESAVIPAEQAAQITAKLAAAKSAEDVKAAFGAPRAVMLIPQDSMAVSAATQQLAKLLQDFLAEQAERVADWVIEHLPAADQGKTLRADVAKAAPMDGFPWSEWVDMLVDPTAALLRKIHRQGMYDVFMTLDLEDSFALRNKRAERYAKARAAELVGTGKNKAYSITESTREMIRGTVTRAMEEGVTPQQLRERIVTDYAFSHTRANAIAVTEETFAYNTGALDGYEESGVVEKVRVQDGDGCEKCKQINGSVWTLEYAREHPLEHPHCKRVFYPIVEV